MTGHGLWTQDAEDTHNTNHEQATLSRECEAEVEQRVRAVVVPSKHVERNAITTVHLHGQVGEQSTVRNHRGQHVCAGNCLAQSSETCLTVGDEHAG